MAQWGAKKGLKKPSMEEIQYAKVQCLYVDVYLIVLFYSYELILFYFFIYFYVVTM